jgi:hypothetical protein
MKVGSKWYYDIAKQVDQLKNALSEKDYRKYRLNLLNGLAQRVDELSPACKHCYFFKQAISTLAQNASNLIPLADKDGMKAHLLTITIIINHLKKQHKLVEESHFTNLLYPLGAAMGAVLGIFMPHIVIGILAGAVIGIVVGVVLDNKAKKENRIICPGEKIPVSFTKTRVLIIIGLVLIVVGGLAFLLLPDFWTPPIE